MTEPHGTEWAVAQVAKIVDGDTVHLIRARPIDIDGRHYTITDATPVSVRLVWVDTPERGQPGYRDAGQDLAIWIKTHQLGGVPLRVVCYESGGWDRIMGDLLDVHGNSASQWLMADRGWPPYTGTAA